jgi:hypothetical protein
MKKGILILTVITAFLMACGSNRNVVNIETKEAAISVPAKGELTLWKNTTHNGFSVQFTNNNEKASCEIYKVNKYGKEKWIHPSLLAKTNINVSVATDGYIYFKNFNDMPLNIFYKIID